jgi:hypothetical protein
MASALHPIAFYPIDSHEPVVRAYSRSSFRGPALTAALANHFGVDEESVDTTEVYWNEDREYAEVVRLDGRIVGAVDRPISTSDIAAMKRVRSMQKRAFINRIQSLFNIDSYLLPELSTQQQLEFVRDPVRYFLKAGEDHSDAIMREIEARQEGGASTVSSQPGTVAKARKPKKAKPKVEGQREMLLPIPGGKPAAEKARATVTPRSKAG